MRRRHLPPRFAALALFTALALPVEGARAAVPVLVAEGQGFGHGVGMAQDGALWMGREGATTAQIIGHFYPGTQFGRASGQVRVAVLTPDTGAALIGLSGGGEIRSPAAAGAQHPGFPVKVPPGGAVQLRFDGSRYHVEPASAGGGAASSESFGAQEVPLGPLGPSTTTTSSLLPVPTTSSTLPPPPGETSTTTTTAPPGSPPATSSGGSAPPSSPDPLWVVPADFGHVAVPAREARYRGMMEATARAPGGEPAAFRLVNQVDVEDYLRGMGEVRDPSWPASGLQTQAIAARTYALRAMAASRELCDTQQCQVYLGQQVEYPQMDQAVRDTQGVVLTYDGRLASAVYSANAGGVSATTEEGFGTPGEGYPYLRSTDYLTRDRAPWRVDVALSDVAVRFGYPGQLEKVRVARTGPSGRAVEVVLDGSAGERVVAGIDFAAQLGLRSTLVKLRTDVAAATPPPPPPPADGGAGLQVLPDAVSKVVGTDRSAGEGKRVERSASDETAGDRDSDDAPAWTTALVLAALGAAGGYGIVALSQEERRRRRRE